MTTEEWIYVLIAVFLWGIIVGYAVREWLPTAEDVTKKWR